ncbi:hypothetical protein [Frankia gtarii]|uniref:hypothetical protein n=1 Tax=Frankia gtarii TaxID=2950102 RepID=UPI0021C14064|nr:hypothetical protein [Frankia gtarii]
MPQIFTAFASEARVNNDVIEGLQSIDYRHVRNRHDVGAIGTDERVAVYFGLRFVTGALRVASGNATLDGLLDSGTEFVVSTVLRHGDASRKVTFEGCVLDEKTFTLSTEAHGEAVYTFSATRVREE